MRRVYENGTLGQVFWVAETAPAQYASFGYGSLQTIDNQSRSDALNMQESQLSTRVNDPEGRFSERVWWKLPSNDLALLLRDDGGTTLREWASICTSVTNSSTGLHCNWTIPVETGIPDSRARCWAGTLSDGAALLFGNQIPVRFDGDTLTLSLAVDGFTFSHAWSVRVSVRSGAPPVRYKGKNKGPGFQYPGALIEEEHGLIHVAYSVGKEDIQITSFPLGQLYASCKSWPLLHPQLRTPNLSH